MCACNPSVWEAEKQFPGGLLTGPVHEAGERTCLKKQGGKHMSNDPGG